ncbi:MAG: YceI family protein [Chitinophagaceae bacterium]|nr:YceI family protein [Chitinophagaceae bacterium]
MKKLLIILLLNVCGIIGFSQIYNAVDAGSEVKFSIRNFGLTVNGSFKGLEGKISFDPASITAASFNVSMEAATVNTGNGSRDRHLKKDDYFDVAKYQKLLFLSSKVTAAAGAGNYMRQGSLTIKGITKQVSFPFTATAAANGYRFSGQFKINRSDFKVGGGSWVLSDELTVSLNVSAIK